MSRKSVCTVCGHAYVMGTYKVHKTEHRGRISLRRAKATAVAAERIEKQQTKRRLMRALYEEGLTYAQVAAALGVSKPLVADVAQRDGWAPGTRHPGCRLCDEARGFRHDPKRAAINAQLIVQAYGPRIEGVR